MHTYIYIADIILIRAKPIREWDNTWNVPCICVLTKHWILINTTASIFTTPITMVGDCRFVSICFYLIEYFFFCLFISWFSSLTSHQPGCYDHGINTLMLRQNRRHFADDIFKCNFWNENVWILIKISLKFVPKGPIINIPELVQIMAWRLVGAKPLSEPMMINLPTHICVTRPQWVNSDTPFNMHLYIYHINICWMTLNRD